MTFGSCDKKKLFLVFVNDMGKFVLLFSNFWPVILLQFGPFGLNKVYFLLLFLEFL